MPQLDPEAAHAAARAARPRCRRARCRGALTAWTAAVATGSTPSPRNASGWASSSGTRPSAASVDGQQHGDQRAVAVGRRVELVGAEQQRRARPRTPGPRIEPSETVRPPSSTHRDRLGGGQPARPGPGDLLERRRDRLDRAEVGAGADHAPRRRRRAGGVRASERWRTDCDGQHRVGDVVGADQDHRDVRARSAGRGRSGRSRSEDWAPTTANVAQVDPAVGPLGEPAGEQRAGRLLDPVDAVPGGAGVAEQRDLDRRAGAAAAVPAGRVGRRVVARASPIARRASLASARSTPYRPAPSSGQAAAAEGGGGRELACCTGFPHTATVRRPRGVARVRGSGRPLD